MFSGENKSAFDQYMVSRNIAFSLQNTVTVFNGMGYYYCLYMYIYQSCSAFQKEYFFKLNYQNIILCCMDVFYSTKAVLSASSKAHVQCVLLVSAILYLNVFILLLFIARS